MATCPRNSTQAASSGHAISEDATGGPRRVVRALIGAGPVLLLVTEDHQDSCRKQAIALKTPFAGSMSVMAIYRQLRSNLAGPAQFLPGSSRQDHHFANASSFTA